ncbi:MAG: hypothetical protein IPL18_13615 [Sphingomonadales bacterium]|nr:hypothetical protein [Sphingomonadales bacterium]
MPHNPHANGRRKIRRDNAGQPYGSGYPLLPLIVKLEELKTIVSDFIERRKSTPKAARHAEHAVRAARRLIDQEIADEAHPARKAVAEIEAEIAAARKTADTATLNEISEALSPKNSTPKC